MLNTAALLHDFGKATRWFQEYIHACENPESDSLPRKHKLQRHSLLSALTTFIVLEKRIPESRVYALLGFCMVRRHHGDLQDFLDMTIITDEDWQITFEQLKGIDYEEFSAICETSGLNGFINRDLLQRAFQEIEKGELKLNRIWRKIKSNLNIEFYYAFNVCYSILLNADKQHAILAGVSVPELPDALHPEQVVDYKRILFTQSKSAFDDTRTRIFNSIHERIQNIQEAERILSINAPTGSGKTLSGIYAALLLKERYNHTHIIYCLPYTSIIDQNYQVYEDIHRLAGINPLSTHLLKHHHLTDLTYTFSDFAEDDTYMVNTPEKSIFMIEGWHSRITVTTFIQLLYTLISQKNAHLRRFYKLCNAVILLDEVQTIPHRYWLLIHDMLQNAVNMLNSRIILMTATMPLIFSEQQNEITELIPDKESLFRQLSRISLDISHLFDQSGNIRQIVWPEFQEEMLNQISQNSQCHILVMVNTIRSARELFQFLFQHTNTHQIHYLSSHIIPRERLLRIEIIKKLRQERGKPVLLIATQLIEAGVDLDFDIVIRDMAPLDSIFQACGRCNRNATANSKGIVKIYRTVYENGYQPVKIYDSFLIEKTIKVLNGKSIIPENEFLELSQSYYNEVSQFHSDRVSLEILNELGRINYEKALENGHFKLIEDDFSFSVFVEEDEDARAIWEEYVRISSAAPSFATRAQMEQIRRQMAGYIINVPMKSKPAGHHFGLYRLYKEDVPAYYDPITGFIPDSVLPVRTETVIF